MLLGQGRAQAITNNDMAALAKSIGCHPATLDAIAQVESAGFGWFDDGRIKILPEPHKFHAALPAAKRTRAVSLGLATTSYAKTKASGHYKKMTNEPGPRYDLLKRQIDYDEAAAYEGMSVGKFQIMGFNYATCGFASAKQMFDAFTDSEAHQLRAFGAFLIKNGLRTALILEDFEQVETTYNGGGLGGAYARKMRAAAVKLKAGKWAGWPTEWPGKQAPPPVAPPAPPAVPTRPVPPSPPVTPPPVKPTPAPAPPVAAPGFWARFFAALFRKAP